ncbi:MAG: glycoside hydrolase family 88 protein [Clostridia bacterium]|nr:glycoside hydrolase family 88 protein [Clostridia bacterium]
MNKDIQNWAKNTQKRIMDKLSITAEQIGPGRPHASKDGIYDNADINWWTNGFWPGILWHAYRATKDEKFKNIAEKCEQNLDEVLSGYVHTDHDAGFLWSLSAVANYKLTGNEKSRVRGLIAANYLAGRFNLRGGFIRAWNWQKGWAIIDCMMNLPLLYWASDAVDDPRYRYVAMAHADTVLREFFRGDGSVNHIVEFDIHTGEVTSIPQGQGYSPSSAWARGTAWAIYGMALSYMYTKEIRYLDAAKRVAHFFISNMPEDYVAYWDFRVPVDENTPKDSSAAACAASGLLEISRFVQEGEKELYLGNALKILKSLTENYAVFDSSKQEILRAGTAHVPQNQNINVGLIYGDYFYVEAIEKLCGNSALFW